MKMTWFGDVEAHRRPMTCWTTTAIQNGGRSFLYQKSFANGARVGIQIPVAQTGNVQLVLTVGLLHACLDELFHRFGRGLEAQLLQYVQVDDGRLAVGVEGQAVVVAVPQVGGQRAVQHGVLQRVEAFDFIHGHDAAQLGVRAGFGDVHARHVGNHAGAQRGYEHLVEVSALTNGFHLDVRVRGLEHGDDHVVDDGRFGVAVGVPEGDGDRLLCGRRGADTKHQNDRQKQSKQLFHGSSLLLFFHALQRRKIRFQYSSAGCVNSAYAPFASRPVWNSKGRGSGDSPSGEASQTSRTG